MNLDNHVVLVTGATGGLGQEFVTQSLARGAAKVYAGARRDHDWGDSRVVPIRLDVTDPPPSPPRPSRRRTPTCSSTTPAPTAGPRC
jgi:NAD(P)-dependent dehydrogenase (short-subunit alcohol dehydrogenase family)